MKKVRFEKFEMKYGYYLPKEFKDFMLKVGGDSHFGSCSFDYTENIINNLIRVYGKMDFHLFPFGIIGNGDYYCFYRYGEDKEDYYVGIWLHETKNFIILCKSFKAFIYRCCLDDYYSTVVPNEELSLEENLMISKESSERYQYLCEEFGFDIEKIKIIKNQVDYHSLMVEFDNQALQSLCYLGKHYLETNSTKAIEYFQRAKRVCEYYTAPYYILGNYYIDTGMSEGIQEVLSGVKTSLVLTGYSYWEEDYIEIPRDVHRNMSYYLDETNISENDFLEDALVKGRDPYSLILRLEIAERYKSKDKYKEALMEYSNALYCCDDNEICKDILKEALYCCREGGIIYLIKIIEQDIRLLR